MSSRGRMDMKRQELLAYLDRYLRIKEIDDYGPQGLQVDSGNETIKRLAVAVDAAQPVIEAAAGWRADMLLVHHGILWKSVEPLTGPLGRRVRSLIQSGVNLYSAHLALDAHPEVGNNSELARLFEVNIDDWWCETRGTSLGVIGHLSQKIPLHDFVEKIELELSTKAQVMKNGPGNVKNVAILSGFGANDVKEARERGADTYLTGETSHADYWSAADYGMNVIYAGHYATETVGVRALGQHLADSFGLEVKFFDFPTGM